MIETANHFRCIDMIIETAKAALTEKYIKELCAVQCTKTRSDIVEIKRDSYLEQLKVQSNSTTG